MKKYLPISLFILGSSLHSFWATNPTIEVIESTPNDVKWIVFYYIFLYLSWLVHCVVEATKKDSIFFWLMGLSLIVRIGLELRCLGMNYQEYIYSITDFNSLLLPLSLVFVSLITVIIHYGRIKRIV